jgi:hypothetical protein
MANQPIAASRTDRRSWSIDNLGLGVLLYAYAVLLGATYLFGFWRPFGFNVFPYLALHDYLSAPLNRVAFLTAVPMLLGFIVLAGSQAWRKNLAKNVTLPLLVLCLVWSAKDLYQVAFRFLAHDHFPNETGVLIAIVLLAVSGVASALYARGSNTLMHGHIAALVLVQSASTMAAGYADGKAIYNGAAEVHFLENRELCETGGLRQWIYLGRYNSDTIFMNSIDKRLCFTTEKNIRLVSRVVSEGL